MIDRREFVRLGLAAGAATLAREAAAMDGSATLPRTPPGYLDADVQRRHPLEFRIDSGFGPDLSDAEGAKLARATYDFLDAEHPDGLTLSFWDLEPKAMPFLRKHLELVVEAVFRGVRESREVHPVDPAAVLALLYNESRFHPKVVSPAGAVGIAQFMPETALEYGLEPIARQDLWDAYRAAREASRQARDRAVRGFRATFAVRSFDADAAIARALATGRLDVLAAYREIADAPDPADDARRAYVDAVTEAFAKHEFFWDGREPLGKLDGRVSYDAATAAVRYLAFRLDEHHGMASTAVAAYNAGPDAVRVGNRDSILHRFGDIPTYGETVRYVQRFMAVYSALKYRAYLLEA